MLVQEFERVLTAFLDRIPPITHDPTTSEIHVVPSFPLNLSTITIQRHIITAFIQLYSAADLDSPTHTDLYNKRMTMAKRSLLLIKILDAVAAELHCSREAPFGNVSPPPRGLLMTASSAYWRLSCVTLRICPVSTRENCHVHRTLAQHSWFPVARVFAQHVRRLRLEEHTTTAELEEAQADLDYLLCASFPNDPIHGELRQHPREKTRICSLLDCPLRIQTYSWRDFEHTLMGRTTRLLLTYLLISLRSHGQTDNRWVRRRERPLFSSFGL